MTTIQNLNLGNQISFCAGIEFISLPENVGVYAFRNHLIEPLKVLIYLKIYARDTIKKSSPVFDRLLTDLNIQDYSILQKHIAKLVDLKWIREEVDYHFPDLDDIADFYYDDPEYDIDPGSIILIRSKHILNLESYLAAAIFNTRIRLINEYASEYAEEINGKDWCDRISLGISNVGNQKEAIDSFIDSAWFGWGYFGVTDDVLSGIWGCSVEKARHLKATAVKYDFLITHWTEGPIFYLEQSNTNGERGLKLGEQDEYLLMPSNLFGCGF